MLPPHFSISILKMSVLFLLLFPLAQATEHVSAEDRIQLFRLAVDAARKEGLDQRPDVRAEMDRILYREFLKDKLNERQGEREPTETQVKSGYEKAPLVKIRQLALAKKDSKRFQKIREGKEKNWGETVDFRGENQLPPSFYVPVLRLRPGDFVEVHLEDSVHLVQLIEKKPYDKAFPTYLEYLRGKIRAENEQAFLLTVLKDLKETP